MSRAVRLAVLPVLLLVLAMAPRPAAAAYSERLFQALELPELLQIMREEGIGYGMDLQAELFPGRQASRWRAMVERIYDVEVMSEIVRDVMEDELAGTDMDPALDFFESARGQEILSLELGARRALLDDDVEAASRTALEALRADGAPILDRIAAFIAANDLIESNVVGALNSNVAFYRGLEEGGAFPGGLTEEEMLRDVWQQEPDIREETETWLYSYLAMAYEPLDGEDLDAYIAFSESEAGAQLNRALFAAFDRMFVEISLALGRGAAQFIGGQEL